MPERSRLKTAIAKRIRYLCCRLNIMSVQPAGLSISDLDDPGMKDMLDELYAYRSLAEHLLTAPVGLPEC